MPGSGLASDIEVVEESPARYDVVTKRQHRWTRGDWQLLRWVVKNGKDSKNVPLLIRWKMVDNLRRSLVAPFALMLLGCSWMLPMPAAWVGVLLVIMLVALPSFLPILFSLWPAQNIRLSNHLRSLLDDTKRAGSQTLLSLAFLADHAWQMVDAIGRTLIRPYLLPIARGVPLRRGTTVLLCSLCSATGRPASKAERDSRTRR